MKRKFQQWSSTISSGVLEFIPLFSGVRVTRSLVLCACFVDRFLSFCPFFLAKVLSFCIRFMDSDYPFSIFKLFLYQQNEHPPPAHSSYVLFSFGFGYSLQKGWTSAISCCWILYSLCGRQVVGFSFYQCVHFN